MSFLSAIGIRPYARVNDRRADSLCDRLRQKLEAGEFPACESILADSSVENRERLIYGFASFEDSVPLSIAWVSKSPDSALAHVLVGASLIVSGWKIRGGSRAKDVNESAWAPFLSMLNSAEEPLRRAIELDDRIAEPYSWLIHAGLGQGAEKQELNRLFIEATSRVPLHFPVHYKYFNATTAKWGGSHEEMFTFVRDSARKAPAGHALHCLVPAAYNDFALAIVSEKGADAAFTALRQAHHAREVAAALHAWLSTTAGTLTAKLESVGGGFRTFALNQFGVALYVCGAQDEARAVLGALNGEIETVPWAWIARGIRAEFNPAFTYDRACKELGISVRQ